MINKHCFNKTRSFYASKIWYSSPKLFASLKRKEPKLEYGNTLYGEQILHTIPLQLTATSYFLAGSNEQSSERRSWRAVNTSANKPDHSKNPKKLECSACNTIPTQYTCIRLYAQLRCKYLSLIYIFPFSFKFAACWDATLSDLYNELSELREREKKKTQENNF